MKAKAKKQPSKPYPEELNLARLKFYGALMANLLHSIKWDKRVPEDLREQAKKRQEQWDKISPYRPLNPITIIELEKALQ